MADWPSTLPQEFPEGNFSVTLADNVIRTNMDIGPAKQRRRSTSGTTKVDGTLLLTDAQLVAFNTFYLTTCAGGATAFNWVHPSTGIACEMRFVATNPPRISPAGGEFHEVQFNLEILP